MESQAWVSYRQDPEIESFIKKSGTRNFFPKLWWYYCAWIVFFLLSLPIPFYVFNEVGDTLVKTIWIWIFIYLQIHIRVFPIEIWQAKKVVQDIIFQMRFIDEKRMTLAQSFAYFLSMAKDDFENEGIDSKRISDISKEINILTKKIQNFQKLSSHFYKIELNQEDVLASWGVNFLITRFIRWHYSDIVNEFVKYQQDWLTKMIPSFTKGIQTFLSYHADELKTLNASIWEQNISTENLSGQWAIDLQRVRLHEHIENLNQLKNGL